MRIQTRTSQHRRDFTAIYACESCGATVKGKGYDDAYFHDNVIPEMVCKSCGVSSGQVTSSAIVPAGVEL